MRRYILTDLIRGGVDYTYPLGLYSSQLILVTNTGDYDYGSYTHFGLLNSAFQLVVL